MRKKKTADQKISRQ